MTGKTAKRILVVDDEQHIADIIEKFLVLHGFLAHKAYGGTQALEVLSEEHGFDLIILDEKMPCMSGTAFRKKMEDMNMKTPVIVLTGSIGMLALCEDNKAVFKNLMIKPVRLSELLGVINKLI